jgi:hypothetical protein
VPLHVNATVRIQKGTLEQNHERQSRPASSTGPTNRLPLPGHFVRAHEFSNAVGTGITSIAFRFAQTTRVTTGTELIHP